MKTPRLILIGFVRVYQALISPLKLFVFGQQGCCRFSPSCSCYAIEALRQHGVFTGSALTARRLLRCHPWGGSGYDPVPAKLSIRA